MSDDIKRSAIFSACRTWRYTLERYWGDGPHLLMILLNPSTADATYDDPTNRRGQGFARAWGFEGVVFCNLFGFRTPDPKIMKAAPDPIGPHNDTHILHRAARAGLIVLAWGTDGVHRRRNIAVRELLINHKLWHMGLTKDGHPKHPLYLRSDTALTQFA